MSKLQRKQREPHTGRCLQLVPGSKIAFRAHKTQSKFKRSCQVECGSSIQPGDSKIMPGPVHCETHSRWRSPRKEYWVKPPFRSSFNTWAKLHYLQSPEGNGNPLHCSCLENPMDTGAWWAVVYGVTQSWTQLKRLSVHACIGEGNGNLLQYSCLENPRDGGAWWAAVHGVAQSWTRLKWLSSSSSSKEICSLCSLQEKRNQSTERNFINRLLELKKKQTQKD